MPTPEVQSYIDAVAAASASLAEVTPMSDSDKFQTRLLLLQQACMKAMAFVVPALVAAEEEIAALNKEIIDIHTRPNPG